MTQPKPGPLSDGTRVILMKSERDAFEGDLLRFRRAVADLCARAPEQGRVVSEAWAQVERVTRWPRVPDLVGSDPLRMGWWLSGLTLVLEVSADGQTRWTFSDPATGASAAGDGEAGMPLFLSLARLLELGGQRVAGAAMVEELREAGALGTWADREDIGDAVAFAEGLRQKTGPGEG